MNAWRRLGWGAWLGAACAGPPPSVGREDSAQAPTTVSVLPGWAPGLAAAPLTVNEVMSQNASSWQPEGADAADLPDWIELLAVRGPVDLGDVTLTDGSGATWRGPVGRVLEAGERYLVIADDADDDADDADDDADDADDAEDAGHHGPRHAPFALSDEGDTLELWVSGYAPERIALGALPDDVSVARTPDGVGALVPTVWTTPGAPNPDAASPGLDPSDAMFPTDAVSAFAITVDPAYEADLDVKDGPGVPGTLTYGGVTLDVEVKLKGSGSFQHLDEKPAFKIDINALVPGQRLRGLKSITLDNAAQDPTYVREHLGYALFRAEGFAAPRSSFATVSYNGADLGLYVHVESVDDLFLARQFADPTGMLLEGTPRSDLGETWTGMVHQEGPLEAETMDALTEVLADPSAPDAFERFGAIVDVDGFTRYAAAEAVSMHWDGYQNAKNYFVYLDPAVGRLVWIPHGTDMTWYKDYGVEHGYGEVFTFCLAVAPCRDAYLDALGPACDTADALDLPSQFVALTDWLAPWADADPRRDDSEDHEAHHLALTLDNLIGRTDEVRAEVAALAPPR